MSFISTDIQLILLAVFLFLYDSSHLVYINESVLTCSNNNWDFIDDRNLINIRGKGLYISNPFILNKFEYILSWKFDDLDFVQKNDIQNFDNGLKSILITFAYVSWILIFICLPYLLFFYKTDLNLLICTCFIYIVSALTGIMIIAYHNKLNLTKKKAINLAIEFLFCPPFNPNVIRKITKLQNIQENLIAVAVRKLSPTKWEELCKILAEKIKDEISNNASNFNEIEKLKRTLKIINGINVNDE